MVETDCEKFTSVMEKISCYETLCLELKKIINLLILEAKKKKCKNEDLAKYIKKRFTEKVIKDYRKKMNKALELNFNEPLKALVSRVRKLLMIIDRSDRGGSQAPAPGEFNKAVVAVDTKIKNMEEHALRTLSRAPSVPSNLNMAPKVPTHTPKHKKITAVPITSGKKNNKNQSNKKKKKEKKAK